MTDTASRGSALTRGLGLLSLCAALALGSVTPAVAEPEAEPVADAVTEPAATEDPAATPDSSAVYVDDRVLQLELTLSDDAEAALRAEPREYVTAELTASIDGQEYGPFDVGARLKGSGSFRTLDGKAAWKLKFGHVVKGQRIFGLKGFTLNNMVQDPSMIAEAATYRLFREVGAPAPRTGYAYLTVNSSEFGLYANVETIDTVFAARWFDSTAHILEGEYGADVTPAAAAQLEVDEGSESDLTDLTALVSAAASDDASWWSATSAVADLESMTLMWALEHVAQNRDSYSVSRGALFPNNYYLHSAASGVFTMIPSGTDQAWTSPLPVGLGEVGSGALFRRCIGVDPCRDSYIAALAAAADREADLALAGHAGRVASAIRPWVERDPRREASLSAVEASQAAKLSAMTQRFVELRSWLASPAFTWSDPAPAPGGGGAGGSAGGGEPAVTATPVGVQPAIEAAATPLAGPAEPATPPVSQEPVRTSALAGLSGRQVARLSPREFGALRPADLAGLTRAQAAYVTIAQWRRLRPAQIAALPPQAVRAIPTSRLRTLGSDWASALRPRQVWALRDAQRRALGLS